MVVMKNILIYLSCMLSIYRQKDRKYKISSTNEKKRQRNERTNVMLVMAEAG